jgi:endoglucanase
MRRPTKPVGVTLAGRVLAGRGLAGRVLAGRVLAGTVLVVVCALLLAGFGAAPAQAGSLSGTLYRDPHSQAAQWVRNHPQDHRTPRISSKIASRATGKWFATYEPKKIKKQVSTYVSAAQKAKRIPVLVPYAIPHRDCNGASSGGAPSYKAYTKWIGSFAQGLGTRRVIVILEPDSLVQAHDCSSAEVRARTAAIKSAAALLRKGNPRAKVYLDAGHSNWRTAKATAKLLKASGVTSNAGFFTNVSNYRTTKDERAFGKKIRAALGNPKRVRQIIDVSRNGAGPKGSEWCDPSGRKIGVKPTLKTSYAWVDGYLWIKPPGEADGCAAGAGQFLPSLAYSLARP